MNDRGRLLLDLARQQGHLVVVSKAQALSWKKEWAALRGSIITPRAPRPRPLRRAVTPRSQAPAPSLLEAGAWVFFRPHASSPFPGTLLRVVCFVPAGAPLDALLSPEQLGRLESHCSVAPTPRYSRVVLGVPGSWRAITSYRTVLAGSFAARARLASPAEVSATLADADARALEPLAPGTSVRWLWHSSHGETLLSGFVIAYIPAGAPLITVLPRPPAYLRSRSQKDRYLVRVGPRGRLATPAAHLVEASASSDGVAS